MYTYSKVGSTQTLSNKIQSEIEKSILQKKFVPGDKLPTEKEMCEMFGVSRTALREALQMLSIQGLITIRKGSGIYVSEYNLADAVKPMNRFLQMTFDDALILQVVEVRKMFEPQIAWLAARNRDEEDVKYLEKNLSDLNKYENHNAQYIGEIHQNFHLRICQATKNPIIALQMEPILRLMPGIWTIVHNTVDTALSETVKLHEQIFEAIRDQDDDGAREAMIGQLVITEEQCKDWYNHNKETITY
ncbi:MAG: FadR family transcriptional regulator [FCB group bacterium]|nr:FadR family transcriptional regulator [FCB group bacterium]